jgi:hypothetical protein
MENVTKIASLFHRSSKALKGLVEASIRTPALLILCVQIMPRVVLLEDILTWLA